MTMQRIEFTGAHGTTLAGAIEWPDGPLRHTALFAHCFTCGKDSLAASRISRALARQGVAVLRFDFTGLGGSDGDFGNSGFSSNLEDLVAAAAWLGQHHAPPELLIGHSLGGTAVVMAAPALPSVKAVVTIGAPSQADHVLHLLADADRQLGATGAADDRVAATLGGREFCISRCMLDDLRAHGDTGPVRRLRAALLVCHAPLDETVDVDEAQKLFTAAVHPKSFISLHKANHLLTRQADADYVALVTSAWASQYLAMDAAPTAAQAAAAPAASRMGGEVHVAERDHKFLCDLHAGKHHTLADEPASVGGSDLGPTPYDLLLQSLGACTAMTLRLYAGRKRMALRDVQVRLRHDRVHADDCAQCAEREGKVERMTREITLQGDLSDAERADLLRIADRCPVHRTLESHPVIVTTLAP